jgi:flagellar basal-body rod modification protein FlgD
VTTIDPIGATGASAGTSTTHKDPPPAENPGAMLDRDAFLKLLVAQLKYQDPTKPADTSQLLSQTAQLTMVDRMNELATSFSASAATQRLSLAGTIVGREIAFVAEDGTLRSGLVERARIDGDQLILTAGGFSVPSDAIVSVQAPSAMPTVAPSVRTPTAPSSPTPPTSSPTTTPTQSPSPSTSPATDELVDTPTGDGGGVEPVATTP